SRAGRSDFHRSGIRGQGAVWPGLALPPHQNLKGGLTICKIGAQHRPIHITFDCPSSVCYFQRARMTMKLGHNLLRSRRIHRSLAILLLAFAVFDMAIVDTFFPQLCNDEQALTASSTVNEPGRLSTSERLTAGTHRSEPTPDSHPDSLDEDCFCCCSHILPAFAVGEVNPTEMNLITSLEDSLPSAPSQSTYRPPRNA
ncbi:MAG: hypothetical protein ABI882_06280, partial [Acidobacteriota bacterium]